MSDIDATSVARRVRNALHASVFQRPSSVKRAMHFDVSALRPQTDNAFAINEIGHLRNRRIIPVAVRWWRKESCAATRDAEEGLHARERRGKRLRRVQQPHRIAPQLE